MKVSLFLLFFVVFFQGLFSQETEGKVIDSLYKEDQFYAGVTYNILNKKPTDFSQNGFSLGFHLGFIKDMPLNKNRNFALGIGIGYSANSFNQNLQIAKDGSGTYNYSILTDVDTYSKNKFSQHLVELPIEFRWRTSTPVDYSFWRIYSGFKISYVFASTSKYIGEPEPMKYTGIKDFNEIQYGLTLCVGYNTWNFYVYYALNPIFSDSAKLNGQNLDINGLKIGLMFYIL